MWPASSSEAKVSRGKKIFALETLANRGSWGATGRGWYSCLQLCWEWDVSWALPPPPQGKELLSWHSRRSRETCGKDRWGTGSAGVQLPRDLRRWYSECTCLAHRFLNKLYLLPILSLCQTSKSRQVSVCLPSGFHTDVLNHFLKKQPWRKFRKRKEG